ncbi:MAG: hypothetical protein HYW27_01225 [Candidatus Aenigmarchaeota archaeon]|nr:hypothetical protein [Candidatus Aenigmarchaeota archaeon]
MADEFPAFLALGIGIIAVLLIAFNASFVQEGPRFTGNFFLGEFEDKEKKGAIFTGTNFTDQFIPFNFAFEADSLYETKTAEIGGREVSNGVLFGEKSVRYTLEKGDSVTAKFRIESTNAVSPLIFSLNGKEHAHDLREGIHEITIDEPFGDGSVLEIKTASSNWKIWAPSLYRLEGLSINVKAAKEGVDQYIFNIGDEWETMQSGRIDLYMKENIGTLKLDLNGKNIFNGISRDFQPIRFSSDEARKGQNILTFTATPNSKFRGEATMVLFYKHGEQKEVKAIINLTEDERRALKSGAINFKIVDVSRSGGVAARITHQGETTFSSFARAEEGFYRFDFEKDDVLPGISIVSIDAIDGASFLVKDLDVKLEKDWLVLRT